MRTFVLAVAAVFAVIGCAPKEDAVLTFEVENPTAREIMMVCHNTLMPVSLNAEGQAQIVMEGLDAAYAKMFYGREFKWVYFERGDKPVIKFNGHDFSDSFTFEGGKSEAVAYLNRVKFTALPDADYALPFDEYYVKVQAKENDALKLMKANSLKSAGGFENMEEGRIRYAYAATLLMHPVGHMMMARNMAYVPEDSYYEVIESYFVEDESWVDVDEYRAFMLEAAHMLDVENRDVKNLYPKTVAQMKFIADRIAGEKVRNTLLHQLAATYVERHGTDDIQDLENIYLTYVKDPVLLADYKAKHDKWDLAKPGKPSPKLEAVDVDGRVWTLDDFRGKYVFIDMWATWCAPCRREMPYLKALEEKFHGAEIVFVGLSTDKDKSKWEEMVRGGSLSGVQLHLGPQSAFQKAYNVEGIPHFILLDKEGKIISNNMSKPSAPDTGSVLESMISKN